MAASDWTAPLDAYCERLGPAFWAEPLNAASNVAFLVAAAIGFGLWRRTHAVRGGAPDRAGLALVLLVAVIGAGSFLFHSFANRWSSLADVVPIALFIYAYFGLALYRLVGLGRLAAVLGTAAFAAISPLLVALLGKLLGSSAGYAPALLALIGIGFWLRLRGAPGGQSVLAAAGVFALSLGFRMADLPLCPSLPSGTHFLWHILNAATLGILLAVAIRRGPRPSVGRAVGSG